MSWPNRLLVLAAFFCSFVQFTHGHVEPKILAWTFEKVSRSTIQPSLSRREKTASVAAISADDNSLYLVNTTVGTPPQSLGLQLDTGSTDVWLPSSNLLDCTQRARCVDGSFNPDKSNTLKWLSGIFNISYVDKTAILGEYFTDVFTIGNVSVANLTMGLARNSTQPTPVGPYEGIVGVGFPKSEAMYGLNGSTYPSFMQSLVDNGHISTQAFSLWLNSRTATHGTILFGGVDAAKHEGNLSVLPLQPDAGPGGEITSFTISWDNIRVTSDKGQNYIRTNLRQPIILDSGASVINLPHDIAVDIANGVGALQDPESGVYLIPCNAAGINASISFGLGNANGVTIDVPFSEFVIPFGSDLGITFGKKIPACRWGVAAADAGDPLLFGDSFLRSAYVVYDLAGAQIAIAPIKFNATDSDIKEITAAGSIPGASTTISAVPVTQTVDPASMPPNTGKPILLTGTSYKVLPTGTFGFSTPSASGSGGMPTPRPIGPALAGLMAVAAAALV